MKFFLALSLLSSFSIAALAEENKTIYFAQAFTKATLTLPVSYDIIQNDEVVKRVSDEPRKEVCFVANVPELKGITYDFGALDQVQKNI